MYYIRNVVRFIKFLFHFNGVVVVAKLPHSEQEKTGYFHRIRSIDALMANIPVVYADWNTAPLNAEIAYGLSSPEKQSRHIYRVTNFWQGFSVVLCILRCRKVYFHHVASVFSIYKYITRLAFITSFIDFHGAAPEEHEMAGYHDKVALMGHLERFALIHITYCVVVTKAMQEHLKTKYADAYDKHKFIILPIIQFERQTLPEKHLSSDQYTIVYAGNMQAWQQVPKMIKTIIKTANDYKYILCCTAPAAMNDLLPNEVQQRVRATTVDHADLLTLYESCDFGFALREDTIVNKVACPTKLIEYLAYGIIPIVDTPNIGDFCEQGMQYVTVDMLENKNLPNEEQWLAIIKENWKVFERLLQTYYDGRKKLGSLVCGTFQ